MSAPYPFIQRARGNVQGARDLQLAPKVLLLGPTESGKDAAVRTVEFALTGTVRDVCLRDTVALAAELMALAPGRSGELWAEVEVAQPDGTIATARHEMLGGSKPAPTWSKPAPAWLESGGARLISLRAIKDAIKGSEETARAFFMASIVGKIDAADVTKQLPKALSKRYARGLALSGKTPTDPVAALQAVAVTAKQQKTEAKAALKAAQRVLDGMSQLGARPSEGQIVAAKRAVAEAKTALEAAAGAEATARAAASQPQRDDLERQLTEAHEKLARWRTYSAQLDTEKPKAPEVPPDLAQKLERGVHLVAVATQQKGRAAGAPCALCGTATDAAKLAERIVRIEAAIAQVQAQVEAARGDQKGYARALAEWNEKHAKATRALAAWPKKISELEGALSMVPPTRAAAPDAELDGLDEDGDGGADDEATDPPLTLTAARQALTAAETRATDLATLEAQWVAVETARTAKVEGEADELEWGQLQAACEEASRALVTGALDTFCARVQRFLPDDHSFDLRVREGTRNVFQFGLLRDTEGRAVPRGTKDAVLHTVLSGSTTVRVHCALACAMATPDRLNLVLADDRGREGAELAASMRALRHAPCQVILMSTVPPKGQTAGWEILELERPEPGAATPETVAETPAKDPVAPADPAPAPAKRRGRPPKNRGEALTGTQETLPLAGATTTATAKSPTVELDTDLDDLVGGGPAADAVGDLDDLLDEAPPTTTATTPEEDDSGWSLE